MGMHWLRPFVIEVAAANDDSIEGASTMQQQQQQQGQYGRAWLLRLITSTYGSILLLLILGLELWLLTNSIHQIGLRAITLDPVHDNAHYCDNDHIGGGGGGGMIPT
ncbi:hypothetical protein SYNPS1DRAFT_29393 [Syncephalis pseudoplumigaleata]|uniref:Uncharacterized protein n=1 Tax=Syncephalis pseudoplumigaleata TaxID=1712513 RepID=A0A4P9YY37_9FUNG|nr:hypothetical protein SYNPS1DRAFT_29393 [Syncephalis pseudoplumigaleata]|eukprot:RKP24858.1 hypothetical protein SYNPS1DRAFT_29393 [Syncephalis pseudoplumigaleata]